MLRSVEGRFRDGKIELLEPAPTEADARVIVTFLPGNEVSLQERGIGPDRARDLRSRLQTFEEDWGRPEMDAYDAL